MKELIRQQPWYVKLTCALLSMVVLGYVSILGKAILCPLLFAALLAMLLQPLAAFLERKCRLPRGIAAIAAVFLFLTGIALLCFVLGGQANALAREWPQFRLQLAASLKQLQTWVSDNLHMDMDEQLVYYNHASAKFLGSGTTIIGPALLSVSSLLFFCLFTFIYTVFFLQFRNLIMGFFTAIFGKDHLSLVHEIAEKVQTIIRQYVIGLLIEMASVTTALCIAFSLIGIRYAILLGLLGGLFNLIPYIGILLTLIISVLMTAATTAVTGKVLLVIIVLVGTHLIDANLLFPWVVGSKVRINPMAMIAGVIVGELIWGIAGMFLSIPVLAVLKIIFDRVDSLKPCGLLLGSGDKRVSGAG
jgi:putative permease